MGFQQIGEQIRYTSGWKIIGKSEDFYIFVHESLGYSLGYGLFGENKEDYKV